MFPLDGSIITYFIKMLSSKRQHAFTFSDLHIFSRIFGTESAIVGQYFNPYHTPPPPVQYSHSTHTFTGCWAHRICGNFDFSLRYTYTSNAYLSVLQLPIEWQCILVGQPTLPALSHDVCNHSSAKAFQNNFLYSFALNISCDVHLIHVRFMWLLPFLSHIVTHTHTKLSRQLFSTKCHLNNSSGKHKKQHSNKIDC